MIPRYLQGQIEDSLAKYPAVGLVGPRQVGKTTLAKAIQAHTKQKAVYIDLELPSDHTKLRDAELYLGQFSDRLVIIDEIQRMPSLFPLMRALIDQRRTAGRFFLLGSASPDLIRQVSETLAGRIIYHELTPFAIDEVGKKTVTSLWLRGGYPLSFLSRDDQESFSWREAFMRTYLEMEIPQLGVRVPASELRRFWTMVAHLHGQLWNASQIANSLGVSAPTVRHYLDILEGTFIVRQLQPYHSNIKKRLTKSPKVYIRDSGILHTLLRIRTSEDLQGHPSVGSSWEGFVVEQLISMVPADWQVFFYRTAAGAEIDLLLLDGRNRIIAIEVKYSLSPKLSKGFRTAWADLSCHKGYVVYPGKEAYPIDKSVTALPVQELVKVLIGARKTDRRGEGR